MTTGPIVFPAFAGNSVVVASETKDIDGNGYPDIVFSTTNGLGDPIGGIAINVTFVDTTKFFLAGSTNMSGLLLFRNVPSGNYTWISSSGSSGSIEVPYDLLDISREESFLIVLLTTKFCENTTQKGLSTLRGLAELASYEVAIPEVTSILDNSERARLYYDWLSGLDDFVSTQEGRELARLLGDWLGATMQVYGAFGKIKTWLDEGYIEYETDGSKFDYYIGFSGAAQKIKVFASAGGFEALNLILSSSWDLFINNGTDVLVRVVTLDEATWQERLQVIGDFVDLTEGILKLTSAIGESFFNAGASVTSKLARVTDALGGFAYFISAALTLLELGDKYGGNWNRVFEELVTPYVLITVFEVGVMIALGTILLATAAGVISTSSILAIGGPIGIALEVLLVVATVLIATLDWLRSYWEYVDSIKRQITESMDSLIPIRRLLWSYNLTNLEEEMDLSISVAQLSSKIATQTQGEARETLYWAADYFNVFSNSQNELIGSIQRARPVVDEFIDSCLSFDSWDNQRHIRAHLVGINSTYAQYSKPDGTDGFPFIASVYHPSDHDSAEYVYDNHTITSNNLDGEYSEIDDYDEISWWYGWTRTRGGWAWETPVENDNEDRAFAVTYTTDPAHHPSGTSTGFQFFFDSAGQGYSWRFHPDETYRSNSRLSPDPNTNATSFFYHYKLFFDSGTTGEYWGYGRPDALDEWMQSLRSQQPNMNIVINDLFAALNGLRNASSRKPSSSLDSVPPSTTLTISEPKKADMQANLYVASSSKFTLSAKDNPHGTGIANTLYRIENNNQSSDWRKYSAPFYLKNRPNGTYIIEYYSIDVMGNIEEPKARTVILEQVHSDIQFIPNILDPKNHDMWLMAYMEIPNLYNITNLNASRIDVSTVLLNATLSPDAATQKTVGDYDGDAVVDLMVKFNVTTFLDFLNSTGTKHGLVILSITGFLEDGVPFEGTALLRVGTPADINHDGMVDIVDMAMAASAFGAYPGHPRWNSEADANNDNKIDIYDLVEIALDFGATDL